MEQKHWIWPLQRRTFLRVFDIDSERWFRALAPPAGGDGNYNQLKLKKVSPFYSCKILVNSDKFLLFFLKCNNPNYNECANTDS